MAMTLFELALSNGATLAGRYNLPTQPVPEFQHVPLLVGLHGGTYDSSYFDANEHHSASTSSDALMVPFVAIDRPSYGGSSPLPPTPEGSNFAEETGRWLHEYILPALWTEFGVKNNCTCIILQGHSMGVMGAVVAAGLYAQDVPEGSRSEYPLGGIILAGSGTRQLPFDPSIIVPISDTEARIPLEVKNTIMLPNNTADASIYDLTEELDGVVLLEELSSLSEMWFGNDEWRLGWTNSITVPVMVAMAGQERFVEPTEEHLREFLDTFSASSRRDGSIVAGAPHCMELSFWSQGWYARCFGFARECAESYARA